LLETGWSWQQYVEAPDRVVTDMFILLDARGKVTKAKDDEIRNG
jgi:hypothetical protein